MALMALAARAADFGPWENQLVIGGGFDHFGIDRLPNTGPACAAVEFMLGGIGREITAGAVVDARSMVVVHIVGKGTFCAFMSEDLIGSRREQPFPLFVSFHDF